MSEKAQRVQLGPFFKDGSLLGGAFLYHFEAGLSSIKHIWQDQDKVIELANPFQADQNGMFNFFADGLYKIVICHPSSTGPTNQVLYTLDNWSWIDPTDTNLEKGEALPSASTVPVGPNVWAHVLGSTTITALSSALSFFWLVFDGTPTLVHSASLLLPGSRNRKMVAGDVAFFLNEGSGIFRLAAHMESEGNFVGRKGANTAGSATLTPPPDGDFLDITGNDQDITAIASAAAGYRFTVRFTGSGNQFLHNGTSLICPYGRDYRTMTNELIELRSLGSGNWIMAFKTGPTDSPGTFKTLFSTAADDGYVLPIGQALNCTRYAALAKRYIPQASVIGYPSAVGTPTFLSSTDVWTLAAHGLENNTIVHLNNAGGGLPTNFLTETVYYVINASANTFQLSATRGGLPVDASSNGTGTHSVYDEFEVSDVRGVVFAALDNLGGTNGNVVTADSTNGANASILGARFGTETHILDNDEAPIHGHTQQGVEGTGGSLSGFVFTGTGLTDADQQTSNSGGGLEHSNTQPTQAVGVQLRW